MTNDEREVYAMIEALNPLIYAYQTGQLTPEEKQHVEAVAEAIFPILAQLIGQMWQTIGPILHRLELLREDGR